MVVAYGVCLLDMQVTIVVLGCYKGGLSRMKCLVCDGSEYFNVLWYAFGIDSSNSCRVGYVCVRIKSLLIIFHIKFPNLPL